MEQLKDHKRRTTPLLTKIVNVDRTSPENSPKENVWICPIVEWKCRYHYPVIWLNIWHHIVENSFLIPVRAACEWRWIEADIGSAVSDRQAGTPSEKSHFAELPWENQQTEGEREGRNSSRSGRKTKLVKWSVARGSGFSVRRRMLMPPEMDDVIPESEHPCERLVPRDSVWNEPPEPTNLNYQYLASLDGNKLRLRTDRTPLSVRTMWFSNPSHRWFRSA